MVREDEALSTQGDRGKECEADLADATTKLDEVQKRLAAELEKAGLPSEKVKQLLVLRIRLRLLLLRLPMAGALEGRR